MKNFLCEALNKEINVNWNGIVFVEQTGHIPTVAQNELSGIVTKMADYICDCESEIMSGLEFIAERELSRIVEKYNLNESDKAQFSKLIHDEIAEIAEIVS